MSNDRHLWPVVSAATKEDLAPLVDLLKDKSISWTPDRKWSLDELKQELHDELLANGGNSFANLVRDAAGPPWAETVRLVAKTLNVKVAKSASTPEIELKVAQLVLERAVEEMTAEQREELRDNLERAGLPKNMPLGKGMFAAGMLGGRIAGFASYKVMLQVANAVAKVLLGRGLSLAGNAALTRMLGLALGPIGWAVTGLLTAIDIAGPAMRITIPSVILVCVLRSQQKAA